MRFLAAALLMAGTVLLSGAARADYDDKIWIAQCVRDNAGAEVGTSVLFKYCKCMTDRMDDEETKSVTEWEFTHPDEKAACRIKAKWAVAAPAPAPAPAPSPTETLAPR